MNTLTFVGLGLGVMMIGAGTFFFVGGFYLLVQLFGGRCLP